MGRKVFLSKCKKILEQPINNNMIIRITKIRRKKIINIIRMLMIKRKPKLYNKNSQ